jgi:hypothetical protein
MIFSTFEMPHLVMRKSPSQALARPVGFHLKIWKLAGGLPDRQQLARQQFS